MQEKQIEERLVQEVKRRGGICPKFTSPGFAGMPDRLILLPGGRFAFVELKAPGQKPRPLQKARHELLKQLGFQVYVIDSVEQIETVLDSRHNAPHSIFTPADEERYGKDKNASEWQSGACKEVVPK